MNKKAQEILENHLKESDKIGLNKCVINAMEEFAKYYHIEQLTLTDVGWQSEQLPDFDVQEINDILKECKENKDDLQTLITRIWNKGYMTGVCYDAEND